MTSKAGAEVVKQGSARSHYTDIDGAELFGWWAAAPPERVMRGRLSPVAAPPAGEICATIHRNLGTRPDARNRPAG